MNDEERAGRYHDEHWAGRLTASGFPQSVIRMGRANYIISALANDEAVKQLREMYPEDK